MKTKVHIILLLILFTIKANAQFQKASLLIDGITLPYQVLYPENYDESRSYPLIVFLHGENERGNDNEKQLTQYREFFTKNLKSPYEAIVIVPQCPENGYWSSVKIHSYGNRADFNFKEILMPTLAMQMVISLIEDWASTGRVDTNRIYAGGISMGGMGTFDLLYFMPRTFAAAFTACGGGNPDQIYAYSQNTAVWLFHGTSDNTVPSVYSTIMYNALKNASADTEYTDYPGAGHNIWEYVSKEKELIPWLFKHSLK